MDIQSFESDKYLFQLKRTALYYTNNERIITHTRLVMFIGFIALALIDVIYPWINSGYLNYIFVMILISSGLITFFRNSWTLLSPVIVYANIIQESITNTISIYNKFNSINKIKERIIIIIFLLVIFGFLWVNTRAYDTYHDYVPNSDMYLWIKSRVKKLRHRRAMSESNTIKFTIKQGYFKKVWKCYLSYHSVFLLNKNTVHIVERDKFTMIQKPSSEINPAFFELNTLLSTDFMIDDTIYFVSIDKTSYERYLHWKKTPIHSKDYWHVPWA